jgi:hypothetical protein
LHEFLVRQKQADSSLAPVFQLYGFFEFFSGKCCQNLTDCAKFCSKPRFQHASFFNIFVKLKEGILRYKLTSVSVLVLVLFWTVWACSEVSAISAKQEAIITGKLLSSLDGAPSANVKLALCEYKEFPNQGILPGQKMAVTDKSGGPFVGVVWVGSQETASSLMQNNKLPKAKSDAKGDFVFKNVPLGKYVITLAEGKPCYSFIQVAEAPVVVSIETLDQVVNLGEVTVKKEE